MEEKEEEEEEKAIVRSAPDGSDNEYEDIIKIRFCGWSLIVMLWVVLLFVDLKHIGCAQNGKRPQISGIWALTELPVIYFNRG